IIQYLYPTLAIPDLVMAVARNRVPLFSPLASLTVGISLVGMMAGIRRVRTHWEAEVQSRSPLHLWLGLALSTAQGTFYMLHWLVVMSSTTARVSFRQKRLKWVKTVHNG
ncbi:MAG: glycosyltransferase family 2 protein, partial [Prochlorothrix sp.]|nr:glycosyltransferase family 2 protein [Prochlorothrix sp.]